MSGKREELKKVQVFAILTNEITKASSDKSVKEYKKFKNLKKQNLRDNMTNLELVLICWQKLQQQRYLKT